MAGQAHGHALLNHTAQPCRYLVFGNSQAHDVAVFPDSGRVCVKLIGERYRRSARMADWDDVDSTGPTGHAPSPVTPALRFGCALIARVEA